MNLKSSLNHFGKNKIPFLFVISYDLQKWEIIELNKLPNDLIFSINEIKSANITKQKIQITPQFTTIKTYKKRYKQVIEEIKNGNTYLLNLTTKTKINSTQNLYEIYKNSSAKYKIFFKNKFVSFSPETFIKIENNKIFTYPMKGTISADIVDAKNKILKNKKELAEHTMIVDLLRNDLNIVSKNVKVDLFRYVEEIEAGDKNLLQVSSKISGNLENNWQERIGDIIIKLLPAGSITGTPKRSTINIIENIEKYKRDYFTGIWGVFDGETIDSSVLIRFIESTKIKGKYIYKSGGGITLDSNCLSEYQEMKDKVYIP